MNRILKHNLKLISVCIISFLQSNQLYAQQERPAPPAYAPSTQVSFVRTWNATAPEQDPNILMARPLKDVKQSTNYLDGLGRQLQTVIKQGSLQTGGSPMDFVTPVEYDEFDRESYKYLPFSANNTGGNSSLNDGAFKLNPFQQQAVFMNARYGSQNEAFFYGKTNYEASPLNKVTDTYAPGTSWVGSETNVEAQRRNVQTKRYSNTVLDEVRIWTVTNSMTIGQFGTYSFSIGTNSIYPAGELNKNIAIDEHKKQTIEFKDKQGNLILKKVQLTALPDDGTGSGYSGWLCTYYLYDDFSNVRCVIQPEGVKQLANANWQQQLNMIQLAEQCFRYEYDVRNRLIMKKVPGSGEVYLVYDKLDRLVMMQDANMRQGTTKWLVTKYDELSRPIETGLWTNNISFATHLSSAYVSSSYPSTVSGYEQLTFSRYDDYTGLPSSLSSNYITTWNSNFSGTSNSNWPYPQMPTQSNATRGMVTWRQIKILETANTYIYTATIYDDKGRGIQSQSTNITGGVDVNSTQYNWAGQPLITVQKQDKSGDPVQTHLVVTKVQYDDLGRILNVKKTVSSNINNVVVNKPEQLIVQNEYDQLGQIKKKTLGANNLETLSYDYNIRGWMLGINRDYAKDGNTNNYFGFDLGYDKANNNIVGNQIYTNPQYNGNIEGMVWKSKGDGEKRKYDFGYDAANRLLRADFTQFTGGTFNQTALVNYDVKMGDGDPLNNNAYDANGNILQMQQWGWKLTGSEQIDGLIYTYQPGSNKLAKVTDTYTDPTTKLGDFKDGNNGTADDYSYDVNGNLITDQNKKILSIQYNHLNLPQIISVEAPSNWQNGSRTITYTYDAAGNKLKKLVSEVMGTNANRNITTTYINGFVYETKITNQGGSPEPDDHTDLLQFIPQEEGRIRFKPAAGNIAASFQYDYMLKDHLGNVRMVLTEEQQQDRYPAATLEDDTYQGGIAVNVEGQYYNIVSSKIVPATSVTGLPTYQNNNGVTNNNPYSNTGADSKKLYKLDATSNNVQDKNGLGIVLKVMAGDAINIWGKSYHKMPSSGYNSSTNPLSVVDLMNLLATSQSASGKGITGVQISGLPGFPTNVTNLLNNQPPQNSNRPRASINWIILDEQFKYVSGGFDMVGTASSDPLHPETFKEHSIQGISIPKNGYIYVYCSNESQYPVFFDNLQVVHDRGPILEETHYYPFGLIQQGISSRAANVTPNKEKTFQGQRNDDDFGLNWIQFKWRNHDPQIGRFVEMDPLSEKYTYNSVYAFSENQVTAHIELEGLEKYPVNDENSRLKTRLESQGKQRVIVEPPISNKPKGGASLSKAATPALTPLPSPSITATYTFGAQIQVKAPGATDIGAGIAVDLLGIRDNQSVGFATTDGVPGAQVRKYYSAAHPVAGVSKEITEQRINSKVVDKTTMDVVMISPFVNINSISDKNGNMTSQYVSIGFGAKVALIIGGEFGIDIPVLQLK